MANFSELYLGNELNKLRDGLDVIERVIDNERIQELELYLYGIVTDEFILDVAKEAIIDNTEEFIDEHTGDHNIDESELVLTEIAIGVPISGPNAIDVLFGRGVPLDRLNFAYQTGEGEGIRSMSFIGATTTSARLRADDMKSQALAETDMELDEFLKQKGTGSKIQVNRKVQRDEEATVDAPHTPEPQDGNVEAAPPAAPATPAVAPQTPPVQKQTSLKISALLEDFLG